jgi:hypothetical protein
MGKKPRKLLSIHNMKPNTFARQEYKGKIYVKNIRKIHARSENTVSEKSDPGPKKNHSHKQRCFWR